MVLITNGSRQAEIGPDEARYILDWTNTEQKIMKQNTTRAERNRLGEEKSPYLLQHADNPVHWYPWGKEAFDAAKKQDKPIFLSIGYSTCHWCHVMAHESFEDPEVARLMNETFISIKVDREERPDIDHIYMSVCQMLTGSGGWPLTVIMTPEQKPFFAGTYFPRESLYGRLGMLDLIPRIGELWSAERQKIMKSTDQIMQRLRIDESPVHGAIPDDRILENAFRELDRRFDEAYGGFGSQPKFPVPHTLRFLLRYWKRTGSERALYMVERTLRAMHRGGIYDHVGYGFHRYSTDNRWLVPHFEKMLYDQALLGFTFVEAYQATAFDEYKRTAQEIFAYVMREMQSSHGGFYSAEDADSEGVEGKFYTWSHEEIKAALGDDIRLGVSYYGVEPTGNFQDDVTGRWTGVNILNITKSPEEAARLHGISFEEFAKRIDSIRQKLFMTRERRIHPHKDDKILTDWNGLMIASMAFGGRVLGDQNVIVSAERAARFILDSMVTSEGDLLHRYRDGDASIPGTLDDYIFFSWALLELFEATFNEEYLAHAIHLSEKIILHFGNDEGGALYLTSKNAESLLFRPREFHDGSIPSGNSVAVSVFLRLGHITGNISYLDIAAGILRDAAHHLHHSPSSFTMLLCSLDYWLGPRSEIVITGGEAENGVSQLYDATKGFLLPSTVILVSDESSSKDGGVVIKMVEGRGPINGRATAYVCENETCSLPITDPENLKQKAGSL